MEAFSNAPPTERLNPPRQEVAPLKQLNSQDSLQPSAVSNVIEEYLRDEILTGKLKPGTRIKQQKLAHSFNVSRMPVREVLRRLEGQGLLVGEFYKGYVVSPDAASADLSMRLRPLQDLYAQLTSDEARKAFESEVLRLIRGDDFNSETPPDE